MLNAMEWKPVLSMACFVALSACESTSTPTAEGNSTLGHGQEGAERAEKEVFLAMTFPMDGLEVATSACVEARELLGEARMSHERALERVFSTAKQGDRAAILDLMAEQQGCDRAKHASALAHQLAAAKLDGIEHAFHMGDVVALYASVSLEEYSDHVLMYFQDEPDAPLLACNPRTPATQLLFDWLKTDSSDRPVFCEAGQIKKATYRVPVQPGNLADHAREPSTYVRLAGYTPEDEGSPSWVAILEALEGLASSEGPEQLSQWMIPNDGERLSSSWASSSDEGREAFLEGLSGIDPLFLFDADPMFILYGRAASKVRTMYFLRNPSGRMLLANVAQITTVDLVFKTDSMEAAAAEERPFASLETISQ